MGVIRLADELKSNERGKRHRLHLLLPFVRAPEIDPEPPSLGALPSFLALAALSEDDHSRQRSGM